ncbi:Uncharacterised protein [Serratia marcescens]|uniref:MrpH family fimbial adhesin n=1 Tax=Serratia marcescens TaxID=615 RepID=UPI0018D6DECC|nr:hypothetical protein [Serratia marcescens]MBH2526201.1 hypothetical protein [Serratia marcescens]MBH2888071.1 hypothetical protein [Serratia marcescens]MBH3137821.1 hypothetical protein [Serratia marcescens]CAI1843828.1 Uncharacterised protein [Serratia marcescens]HEJ6943730.1 hypothetical protein [Serratia marcescens]
MRILARLLSVVIFFGWAGYSYAYEVEINWQPSSDGRGMRMTVLSVNSRLNDNSEVNCGLFASCYVHVAGGNLSVGATYDYDFPKIPSLRGVQKSKKVADAWGASSPSAYISNWGDMVEKIGHAPCFAFDVRGPSGGGHFGSTCDGLVTPPPTTPTPPDPLVSCYMNGNIYLQHGSLADSEVLGNRADATAYIYCTGNAKVRVRSLASIGSDSYMVNLRSDGSLMSLLTVNGIVGNGGGVVLDVPGGGIKEVTFSSSLVTSGVPAPGDFSGSAVAVVDIL